MKLLLEAFGIVREFRRGILGNRLVVPPGREERSNDGLAGRAALTRGAESPWGRGLVPMGGAAILAVVVLGAGCGRPKYPSCDNDEHCTSDGRKGVCVDHACVECRKDDGCASGKVCRAGACKFPEGYCDDTSPCADGSPCGKDHRCTGLANVRRVPTECDTEHPCPNGQRCQNNHCVAPPPGGPGCTEFAAPEFAFESADLPPAARATLERLARCLTTGSLKGAKVLLTGHCDARGEEEFNMGLGANRAENVKTILTGLGVPASSITTSSRGKLDANGKDEAGWSRDRRVDIEVR